MRPRVSLLIIGAGDIGSRLAHRAQTQGIKVTALARTTLRAETLTEQGIQVLRGDLDGQVFPCPPPGPIDTLAYFAPPPSSGVTEPRLQRCLAALDEPPRRIVYISTSGIYGNVNGAWVDEFHTPHPITDRAKRRWHAECQLEQYQKAFNIETVILRVPGIYGPGRLPEARIRAGLPVVLPEESPWSNRIHADDLAEACFKACTEATVTGVFNVSDGHPSTMTDYFWKVSDHLDLPRPPAVSLSEARNILSPAMMSFMDESKRLCNRRMIDILGVKLRYPTLSEGLQAS